jgi:hypothetical protein
LVDGGGARAVATEWVRREWDADGAAVGGRALARGSAIDRRKGFPRRNRLAPSRAATRLKRKIYFFTPTKNALAVGPVARTHALHHRRLGLGGAVVKGAEQSVQGRQAAAIVTFEMLVMQVVEMRY